MVKNQQTKRWIVILFVLVTILPVIIKGEYSKFFKHDYLPTEFDQKQNEVECIKGYLSVKDEKIPLWVLNDGKIERADEQTFYSYQYLFAPVVLEWEESVAAEKFVLLVQYGTLEMAGSLIEGYNHYSCSDELYILIKGE